jgi:hypothetical protein
MKKIALMILLLVLASGVLGVVGCRHHHHSFVYDDHYASR